MTIEPPVTGIEWIVEAFGCDASALASLPRLRSLFQDLIAALSLRAVEDPVWHQFQSTGGVTGLCLLAESHLACHTFPEYESICLNVFCCRPRPDWDFAAYFQREFGATRVSVRRVERPYRNESESRELSQLRRADHVPVV